MYSPIKELESFTKVSGAGIESTYWSNLYILDNDFNSNATVYGLDENLACISYGLYAVGKDIQQDLIELGRIAFDFSEIT